MTLLRFLLTARRLAIAAGVLVLLFLVWMSARRAGRRGLEAAIPLWALAATCFALAVFGGFSSGVDIALVLLSAALLVVSLVALLLLGLAPTRTTRIRLAKHKGPPWEDNGW